MALPSYPLLSDPWVATRTNMPGAAEIPHSINAVFMRLTEAI